MLTLNLTLQTLYLVSRQGVTFLVSWAATCCDLSLSVKIKSGTSEEPVLQHKVVERSQKADVTIVKFLRSVALSSAITFTLSSILGWIVEFGKLTGWSKWNHLDYQDNKGVKLWWENEEADFQVSFFIQKWLVQDYRRFIAIGHAVLFHRSLFLFIFSNNL